MYVNSTIIMEQQKAVLIKIWTIIYEYIDGQKCKVLGLMPIEHYVKLLTVRVIFKTIILTPFKMLKCNITGYGGITAA